MSKDRQAEMDISRTTVLLQAPTYGLRGWRAFEVRAKPDEVPTLHLSGWSGSQTRVCSPIADVDVLLRSCVTRSSKLYQVLASPADLMTGPLLELWGIWKETHGITWEHDVTSLLVSAFREAEREWEIELDSAPEDFPVDYFLGSVPGSQPKFLAREFDGRFVVGPTDEELQERYSLCLRLATQYRRLCEGNRPAVEAFAHESLQGWDLTPGERQWLVAKINLAR